jgi:hypothetical protein
MVAGVFFNFGSHGSWLQAQLKLGSWCFLQFSMSWFVAASSVKAWKHIFFSIITDLVGGCKLG